MNSRSASSSYSARCIFVVGHHLQILRKPDSAGKLEHRAGRNGHPGFGCSRHRRDDGHADLINGKILRLEKASAGIVRNDSELSDGRKGSLGVERFQRWWHRSRRPVGEQKYRRPLRRRSQSCPKNSYQLPPGCVPASDSATTRISADSVTPPARKRSVIVGDSHARCGCRRSWRWPRATGGPSYPW